MSHKALLKFTIQIPHLYSFIRRAAHQEIFLLRKTELEDRSRVSFYCFMLAISWLRHKYTEFFHILIYLSSPQEITFVESALKRTSLTCPLWPTNLNGRIWGLKFHTSTRPSAPPETICFLNVKGITFNGKIQHWLLTFRGLWSIWLERDLQQLRLFLLILWLPPCSFVFK